MKTRIYSMIPAAGSLVALLLSGATATATAQGSSMKGMKDMSGMHDKMTGPHHVLAMAYGDNLATFARALRGNVSQSKTVNLDLARPAVAEMRRSFGEMQLHHKAQMAMMGDQAMPAMSADMKQHMETHMAALSDHLTALESEVNGSAPDPKRVSEHATEILKECAGMSAMPGKGKAHKMK